MSKNLEVIHDVTLDAPEEDYLLLLPALATLKLIIPFPQERRFQDMVYFDSRIKPKHKRLLLDFYYSCLQRHIYAHGNNGFLLSKNAAMFSWQQDLAEYYPDAKFIICNRASDEALASQLSTIQLGIDFFNADNKLYDETFINMFEHYYQLVLQLQESESTRTVVSIKHLDLNNSLLTTISDLYQRFYIPMSENFREVLIETDKQSANYQSKHQYDIPDQYSNSQAMI